MVAHFFEPLVITISGVLWIFDNGQSVLHANLVAESGNDFPGTIEVTKLACAVQRCRAPYDMIVNVCTVLMGANYKGVPALEKVRSKLTAGSVRFLRCDFAGRKGLTNLIGNDVVGFILSGEDRVLSFG